MGEKLTRFIITTAGRYTAEGEATFDGEELRWMVYHAEGDTMRVMLSRETEDGVWRWYERSHRHPARATILAKIRSEIAWT